jgi:crossover junction endodeoxyribonuclease RuvC
MSFVIGIDPGISGAVAIFKDGKLDTIHDMPTLKIASGKTMKSHISAIGLVRILETSTLVTDNQTHIVIEKVGAMPGQGVTSMFNFGRSAGLIEGCIVAKNIPHTYVTPQTWTKAVGRAAGKDASRMRAMELFPAQADLFKRAKDDGRADACLIAHWYITKNA